MSQLCSRYLLGIICTCQQHGLGPSQRSKDTNTLHVYNYPSIMTRTCFICFFEPESICHTQMNAMSHFDMA